MSSVREIDSKQPTCSIEDGVCTYERTNGVCELAKVIASEDSIVLVSRRDSGITTSVGRSHVNFTIKNFGHDIWATRSRCHGIVLYSQSPSGAGCHKEVDDETWLCRLDEFFGVDTDHTECTKLVDAGRCLDLPHFCDGSTNER